MTVARNFESKIETAFIYVISHSADIGTTPVRHWMCSDNGKTYPIILVNASNVIPNGYDRIKSGNIFTAIVDIACMTYHTVDTDKDDIYNLSALIHDVLASSSLLSVLDSATTKMSFLDVFCTSVDSQFDQQNVNIMNFTLEIDFQYVP